MRRYLVAAAVILSIQVGTVRGYSQDWLIGGTMGLSSLDGYAGVQLTPMAEFQFGGSMGVGSELSINTQYGVPLLWYSYFKYHFSIPGSQLRPYANAGPVLTLNIPGAPNFGILFGGGIDIPIGKGLYLAPDMLVGPVFGVGGGQVPFILRGFYWGYETYGLSSYSIPSTTILSFCIRGAIRYEI